MKMKAFVTVEFEVSFTDEETKLLDEVLKKESKTFKYHMSENVEELLVTVADIPKESIKSIEVNRVD
jgi:hypothetical protein